MCGGDLLRVARRACGAHHSLAMYDLKKTYVMTGVIVRVDPNPNHLQLFVAPLNEARDQVLKDGRKEPVVWAIELEAAVWRPVKASPSTTSRAARS